MIFLITKKITSYMNDWTNEQILSSCFQNQIIHVSPYDCWYMSPPLVLMHTYHNEMHDVTAVSFSTNFKDLRVCVSRCTGRD